MSLKELKSCISFFIAYQIFCWVLHIAEKTQICMISCLFIQGVQHVLSRELEPWETVAVGALSGGLAAVVTTPFDVMKTRMMTAPQGIPISMQMIAFSILRKEGPLGLFKGAIPRFFWIAPLGAMNFAGYELAKKAMDKSEKQVIVTG
jgi:Mitochondrial carrier protein